MDAAFCRVVEIPEIGDDLRVSVSDRRHGGRTDAAYIVKLTDFWRPLRADEDPADREIKTVQRDIDEPAVTYVKRTDQEMLEHIARQLGEEVKGWQSDMFGCTTRRNELIITYTHDLAFSAIRNGTHADAIGYLEIDQPRDGG